MRVVVGSAFRDTNKNGIARYLAQVEALSRTGCSVRIIAAEGDSQNGTRNNLVREAAYRGIALEIADTTFGLPKYASVELPARMAALSKVGNAIFDHVRPDDDALFYVESDLVWDAETARRLINIATNLTGYDVVSPLVFAGEHFYDVWAFRKSGERFAPFPPYHQELSPVGLTEVDSVGSCLVMRGSVARACRIRDDNALVGWCADARSQGYRIGVAAELRIEHWT